MDDANHLNSKLHRMDTFLVQDFFSSSNGRQPFRLYVIVNTMFQLTYIFYRIFAFEWNEISRFQNGIL